MKPTDLAAEVDEQIGRRLHDVGVDCPCDFVDIIQTAIEKATEGWRRYALRVEGACKTGSATVEKMLAHQLGLCERENYHMRQQIETMSRAAHASEPEDHP